MNVLRLHHPSIVELVAITVKPSRMLLLQFAPYRTVRNHLITSTRPFSRQVQHRIAHQVLENLIGLCRPSSQTGFMGAMILIVRRLEFLRLVAWLFSDAYLANVVSMVFTGVDQAQRQVTVALKM